MVHVDLAGFAGPIDLLLDLVRKHRVDLGPISVLALTDQVVAALERTGRDARLDRQGEWLVVTTWLVWLKSRLLLPRSPADARQAQDEVVSAVRRLELQEAAQAAAAWLGHRPQLGQDVFARGVPPPLPRERRAGFVALLEAGLIVFRGAQGRPEEAVYRPVPPRLWRVVDALARARAILAASPGGGELAMFLPRLVPNGPDWTLRAKAAVASTFLAGLELARAGRVALHQEAPFASITMQATEGGSPDHEEGPAS